MAVLIFAEGPDAGRTQELGDVTIIGRSLDADIRIDDLTVSRRHSRITQSGEQFILQDLDSGNGTMVNGLPISETNLENGDKIEICDHVLVFYNKSREETGKDPATTLTMVDRSPGTEAIVNTVQAGVDSVIMESAEDKTHTELIKINRRLKIITEISQALGLELDENKLLQQILNKLFDVFPQADRGFVIMIDPKVRKLVPKATKTKGSESDAEIAVSRTIIRNVIEKKQAVLSTNAMDDERFQGGASIVNFQMQSVMCAPLMAQSEVLGIIHIDTKRTAFSFGEDDLALLAGIASQAGLAMANARLHTRLVERMRMERDLQYATRIQHSFLPQAPPDVEGVEFADWYKAALQVGGDFYDYITMPDGRLGIVVGDVSGKGVSAALLMARISSNIRVLAATYVEPQKVLSELNRSFYKTNMSEAFVTVLFMSLDPNTRKLAIANAGHLPPLLRKENDEVLKLEKASGFPIGVMDESDADQDEIQLSEGDVVCAFSDGIIEAMDVGKNCFGYERVCEVLQQSKDAPEQIVEKIRAAVSRHTSGAMQSDDVTLTLFKCAP